MYCFTVSGPAGTITVTARDKNNAKKAYRDQTGTSARTADKN